MKKSILFVFLTFSSMLFGQKGFKINLITSIDHSEHGMDPSPQFYDIEDVSPKQIPYTFGLEIEKQYGSSSFLFGLRHSKKVFHPDLEIVFYYGGRLMYNGDTLNVNAPHLKSLEYKTIALPIYHKQYFNIGKRVSFYTLAGAAVDFRIQRKETYVDFYYDQESGQKTEAISAAEKGIRLFSTSIELGGGMLFKLSDLFGIVLQSNIHLLEFRRSNDQLMNFWPYGGYEDNFYWKDKFLPVSQISLGLGLQMSL